MAQDRDVEKDVLIVVVAMNLPGMKTVPGSTPIRSDCGHDAWVSPSSAALLRQGNAQTLCSGCVEIEQILASNVYELPGSAQELAEMHPGLTPEGATAALARVVREGGGTFHPSKES